MTKAELVFIPFPVAGHLVSAVEVAKLIVDRDERISVGIFIFKVDRYTQSLVQSNLNQRIKFIELPDDVQEHDVNSFFTTFIESKKPQITEAVKKVKTQSRIAGFVLDMLCTSMMEVADEFGVPSYIFYASSAACLGLAYHVQALQDEENVLTTDLKEDSDTEFDVPSLFNPVPVSCLPSAWFMKEWAPMLHDQPRKFRRTKGILVNSFTEFIYRAGTSCGELIFHGKTPPVYTMGPVLDVKGENYDLGPGGVQKKDKILTWLDDQPESSVVFLCFGSMGSFDDDQVKQIACALERSGQRFLWSLRRASPKDKFETPSEYKDPTDVLPEGFLDRTAGIGKIIGWAPQVSVLGHRSVGGFVSHCGWNSTLESLWFGVPVATWPLYGEQQFNAFELVKELALAVEIKMDYRKGIITKNPTVLSAEVIERGIRGVIEPDSKIRKRVKEMSEKGRKALMDGGSSFSSIVRFIDDVLKNIS